MQTPDDASLVSRSIAGDADAFEELVTRYQMVVYRVALRMLGDADEARDAAQSAFIKMYQHLTSFDPRFKFFSWMYRIVLNECLNIRRGRRDDMPLGPEHAPPMTPVDALEIAERRRLVQRALLTLPIEYRQVIVLRYFAELSYDDIAATLGLPARTIKSRLYTARQRLADLLSPQQVGA